MAFPESAVAQLLAACKRHCCVCLKWCGTRIQLHHIHPKAAGGPDSIENAIPVCLDCHAEIESKGNIGRQFSQAELREHKRAWLEICRDRPEVLIKAGQTQFQPGPLEAVLSEIEFNRTLLAGSDYKRDYVTPLVSQFDRALSVNAFAILPGETRDVLFEAYRLLLDVAELLRSRGNQAPFNNAYNELSNLIGPKRSLARERLAAAKKRLEEALGVYWPSGEP